jgi:hypothetical protein
MTLEAIVDDEFSEFTNKLRELLPEQYHYLLEYESVKRFLSRSYKDRSGGITPWTGKMYIQRLSDFCNFEKKNPDIVVKDGEVSPRALKRNFENWFDYMVTVQDRDTAIGKIKTVLSFLSRNDVQREAIGYRLPQGKGQKEMEYPFSPTKEQLLQAFNLDVWKSKELGREMQLYLLAESQSGLSEVDLLGLDFHDESAAQWAGFKDYECIAKQLAEGKDLISVVVRRTKQQAALQVTFFGSEVIERLDRKRTRQFSFPQDGRNLRNYFIIVQEALKEPKFTTHCLRKYFETSLEAADLNQKAIDRMMGHGIKGMSSHYSGLRPSDLEPMYRRAYDLKLRLLS